MSYRFDWPRASFLIFCLLEPRGVVRLPFGAAFLRAVRFAALRSGFSSFFVFAIIPLYVSAVPAGLGCFFRDYPALTCRATFKCPLGTKYIWYTQMSGAANARGLYA